MKAARALASFAAARRLNFGGACVKKERNLPKQNSITHVPTS